MEAGAAGGGGGVGAEGFAEEGPAFGGVGAGIFAGDEVEEDGAGGGAFAFDVFALGLVDEGGDDALAVALVGVPLGVSGRVDNEVEAVRGPAEVGGRGVALLDVVDDDAEALGVAVDGVITAAGEEGYEEAGQEQSLHEGTSFVCLCRSATGRPP